MDSNYISPSYAKKLGISVCSIMQIKDIIFNDIRLSIEKDMLEDKQCFHIIGPAGVGKTQITFQIAPRLSEHFKKPFQVIKINCPVLNRDDFIIPFPSKTQQVFDMLYSGFIPNDPDSFGLFVIDEFSRGDEQLQQLMWQIQNENKIHTFDFPKHWFVVSIDNPNDDEYTINDMEDAAGRRRCLHIYTSVSVKDFLRYAKQKQFHELVIKYIENNPGKLYDFESQKKGMVYANPASWEKVSDHLKKYDGLIDKYIGLIQVLIFGLLNTYTGMDFVKFIKNHNDLINPNDIIDSYDNIQSQIKKLVKEKQNEKLHDINDKVFSLLVSLSENDNRLSESRCINLAKYLLDIPKEIAASFIMKIKALGATHAHTYLIIAYSDILRLVPEFDKKFMDYFKKVFGS